MDVEARERATSRVRAGRGGADAARTRSPATRARWCPGRERAAVTVELELARRGRAPTAFYRSTIRSDERLDYDRVDAIFAGREPAREPWAQPLAAAREAAAALGQARARHGSALTVESEEPEFAFDARRGSERHQGARADGVPPPDRAPDDRRQRGRRAGAGAAGRAVPVPRARAPAGGGRGTARRAAGLAGGRHAGGAARSMSPAQAAERGGRGLAPGGGPRAAHRRARAGGRPDRGADGRPPGAERAGAAVAATGVLLAAQPRPRRAGVGVLLPLHLPDPPLPGPRVPPRAALHAGRPERAPRAEALQELGEWTSAQRARGDEARARRATTWRGASRWSASCSSGEWSEPFQGEVVGLIGAGAFVAFGPPAGVEPGEGGYRYEGMLPVRRLADEARQDERADASGGSSTSRAPSCGASARGRRCAWGTP